MTLVAVLAAASTPHLVLLPPPISCKQQILYVSVCGWSYPFMATTTAVSKGAEMLYDYGHRWGAAHMTVACVVSIFMPCCAVLCCAATAHKTCSVTLCHAVQLLGVLE